MPRLLLVEDNQTLRLAVSRHLEQAFSDLEVATAATCAEAREWLLGDPPDIVLLDHLLPDGNSFSLLAEIREHVPNAQVIVTTASSPSSILRGQRLAGGMSATDVLPKPYEVAELTSVVARALGADHDQGACSPRQTRRPGSAPPDGGAVSRHAVLNRLSGLLAAVRVFESDLLAEAEHPESVRRLAVESSGRFVETIRDISRLVRRWTASSSGGDGR